MLFFFLNSRKKALYKRAILFQAKKQDRIDNLCQRCLYEEDTKFLLNNVELKLPRIDIRHKGLKYLLLNDIPSIKNIPHNANIKFLWSKGIYKLLLGFDRLSFYNNKCKINPYNWIFHWNYLVWYLIEEVGSASVNGRILRGSRGNSLDIFFNYFNDFDNYDKYFVDISRRRQTINKFSPCKCCYRSSL